jgi:hypothetical protein
MANKEVEGTVVRMQDKTTVYATGKCRHYAAGDAITVHPELAKKLIKAGRATEKAVKQ